MQHQISVCTVCRPKGQNEKPGMGTITKLRELLAQIDPELTGTFKVSGVACMAGCDRPCTVGFHASDKATYLFGDIDGEDDLASLVTFAALYACLHDGWCSSVDRPSRLRKKTLARVPASLVAAQLTLEPDT